MPDTLRSDRHHTWQLIAAITTELSKGNTKEAFDEFSIKADAIINRAVIRYKRTSPVLYSIPEPIVSPLQQEQVRPVNYCYESCI
ncbi:MAG: hypothetical protein Fur005_16480 [Roseiflexaceae bacterium]